MTWGQLYISHNILQMVKPIMTPLIAPIIQMQQGHGFNHPPLGLIQVRGPVAGQCEAPGVRGHCYRFNCGRKFCRIGVVGFFGVWPDWYGILSPNCRALIVFVMSGPGRRCSGCVVLRCERGFSAWPISHRTRSDRCGRKVLRQAAIVRPVLIRTLTTGSRFSIAANFLS